MKRHLGFIFVAITYLLTWSVEIPAALTKHGYATMNMSKGLQTICTLSPGIVAILLTGIFYKKNGLKILFTKIVKWRVPIKWYALVFFLSTVLCGISLFVFNWMYAQANKLDEVYNFIFYFILILPISALWEEIGWRGFLLPNLQETYTPLKASLIIGFVWGLWHLPVYLAINPYGDKTIIYFLFMFIGCFAMSIIETWFYNSTKGSLFICILFHNAINTSAAYFYGNLKGAEFRPLLIFIALLVVASLCILVKTKGNLHENGKPMLASG